MMANFMGQAPITWRTKKTVRVVEAMKVIVAARDRRDRRAKPQTPWPEVQPDPKVTPTPTSSPPRIKTPGVATELTTGKAPVRAL
jgi:hypothetical protein